MRLSELIIQEMEGILVDFEEFARTHTAAGADMDIPALRDHAEEMLRAFARDIETPQTEAEQKRKSHGDAPVDSMAEETAAQHHGSGRAGSGFTLEEMFAEYRALRASVLRHWVLSRSGAIEPEIEELIRFNEAIDQAVAESITRYSAAVEEHRDTFLAVLGHDLRTPLSAILSASGFLAGNGEIHGRNLQLAHTIQRSGARMNELVDDLLDITMTRLGRGIPIDPHPVDIEALVRATVEEVRLVHSARQFRFDAVGDLTGRWDGRRIGQALSNVIANAVQHGASDSAITIVAHGDGDGVVVAVRNRGNAIPTEDLAHIFEPFKRRASSSGNSGRSLGLGLYIANQIALAHGGRLDVDSSHERGTTFSLRLPRYAGRGQPG